MCKKLMIALLFLNCVAQGAPESNATLNKKIKLYAFYTPSHKIFLDTWFLPSIKDDFDLILECHEQECAQAAFMREGWLKTMEHKVDLIIRGIRENWGGFFIHSDVDIQFMQPCAQQLTELMRDNDLVIQKDDPAGGLCAGFFACKGNEKTLKLWQQVKARMKSTGKHDQAVLNELLRGKNTLNIRWQLLPNEYCGGGTLTGRVWKPGNPLPLPDTVVVHHANWTVGVENKVAQLAYVRNKFSGSAALKTVQP